MHVYVLCRKRRLPLRAESSSVKKIYYFNLIFSFFLLDMTVLSRGMSCGLTLLSAVVALGSAQLEPSAGIRVAKQATARSK